MRLIGLAVVLTRRSARAWRRWRRWNAIAQWRQDRRSTMGQYLFRGAWPRGPARSERGERRADDL